MRLTRGLPLLLLCALSMAACASEEKTRQAEDDARELHVAIAIQTVTEQAAPEVQCPDDVDTDAGARYRCVATARDGTSVVVDAVQPSDGSTIPRVSTKLLLETHEVEMRLRHDLTFGRLSDAGVFLLDCQDLVEIKKGGHFTCKGTTGGPVPDPAGPRLLPFDFTVRATFTNDRGMINYMMRPS
jgi:hypothetical protein